MENNNKEWEKYNLFYGKIYADFPLSYNLDIQFTGKYLDGCILTISPGFTLNFPEYICYQAYVLQTGQYFVYCRHENPSPAIWTQADFKVFQSMDELEHSEIPKLLIDRVKSVINENA